MLMSSAAPLSQLENESEFIARHIGISEADEHHMLSVIGVASRRALIESIVPASIARSQAMKLPAPAQATSWLGCEQWRLAQCFQSKHDGKQHQSQTACGARLLH